MPIPHIESKKSHNSNPSHERLARAGQRSEHDSAAHTPGLPAEKQGKKGLNKPKGKRKPGIKGFFQHYWAYKWIRVVSYLIGGLIALGFLLVIAAFIWVSRDLADITDLSKRSVTQSTRIYARDGQTVLYDLGDNKRIDVKLKDINPRVIDATLALEDRRFYQHSGFDPIGISRAVFSRVTGIGVASGGSTLTQQFIKNAILTNEKSYTRKAKEVILSVRLESKYSKDEILELYLNEVYYGPNYQGVEAASQEYFHKSVKDVTLSEAAILASLPKNPVNYPRNPERLKTRRDYALDIMVEDGKITKEEAETAKKDEVVALNTNISSINAPHFVFYVIDQLTEKYGQINLRKNGYKVITTLDWDKQQKAEKAVADGIPLIESKGGSNASLVSIDTKTGQIIAMVGSRDYFSEEHDGEVNVATALRQPGSSIKPLVYMTGFERGLTPDTKVWDVETDFPSDSGVYHPRNYSFQTNGLISLRNALPQSLNIPAVKVLHMAGIDNVIDNAEKAGYTSMGDRKRYGLAFTLGGVEVSLLEHTSAFATFAREGERHKTGAILAVEDHNGKKLEEWKDDSKQALNKDAVRMLNSIISDQGLRYAPLNKFSISGHVVGLKTGTTNDFHDAWIMGYTPSIATGVWTGNNDNSEMSKGADGSVIAAPIWFAYMKAALEGTPSESFNKASWKASNDIVAGKTGDEVEKSVDKITGELIPDECADTYPKEYVEKKKFIVAHDLLYYLAPTDLKSVLTTPPTDAVTTAWEKGVSEFVNKSPDKSKYITSETKKAECNARDKDQQPTVEITSMKNGATVDVNTFSIVADVTPGKGRSIRKVVFSVDGDEVQTTTPNSNVKSTRTSNYSAKKLKNGKHTVAVEVTDDKGNTKKESITVTLSAVAVNANTNTSVAPVVNVNESVNTNTGL